MGRCNAATDRQPIIVTPPKKTHQGFDPVTFALVHVGALPHGPNLLEVPTPSIWTASAVVQGAQPGQTVPLDGSAVSAHRSHAQSYPGELTLTWGSLPVAGATGTATVQLYIRAAGPLFNAGLTWTSTGTDLALWQWTLQVGAVRTTNETTAVRNEGFGQLAACAPLGCPSYSSAYPQATYQFMALYGGALPGLYFASHDGSGASKTFSMQFLGNSGVLAIEVVPEGAGVPTLAPVSSVPFQLQLFAGDWWDAAQIYRPFALTQADWTRKGPLVNRTDVPAWLLNMTVWVNSHWQQNDIFNITGGDPEVQPRF
jgi:hypothetical protein